MLKLKLQYFGHLMGRADSLEKTLMLEKIEGRRRKGQQRMRWLDGITDSMHMGLGGLRQLVIHREAWHACGSWGRKDSDVTERLSWTELNLNPEKSNYDWTVKLILSGFLYRNCCALNRYIEYLSSWSISGHFSTPFYWKSEFVLAWCNFILSYKSRLE